MLFENLSERLERSFKILKGEGKITEVNVSETLKDVRKALLDADVNYKVAKTFTDTVKQKALGQNVLTAVKPSQLMVKIVHDELALLMGGETAEINVKGQPAIILMSGLQGSGKTTFSGKLAKLLKEKRNRSVLLVAGDVYRPAAIDQLKVLGQRLVAEGSLSEVPAYPRLVVETALNHNACGVIFCHNHPGGDARPSVGDVDTTRSLELVLSRLGIMLIDHIIVSDGQVYSMMEHKDFTCSLANGQRNLREDDTWEGQWPE